MQYTLNGRHVQRSYSVERFTIDLDDGEYLKGSLLIPETASAARPVPAVICSHFFGGTYRDALDWAIPFAEYGYMGVVFDFRGGGRSSQSSGTTLTMSTHTELRDLLAVIDAVSALDNVNEKMLFLEGQSMGGFVSALAAAERPEQIRGLMLLYPAFSIPDTARRTFETREDISDSFRFMGVEIGRPYFEDVWEMDGFECCRRYDGPVTIFHGENDTIVPLEVAQRAEKEYAHAELHTVHDAAHAFYGVLQEQIAGELVDFVAVQCGEKTRAERSKSSPVGKMWLGFGRKNLRELWT